MDETIYTSAPRKQMTSYQPRPVAGSVRPKYRNPRPVAKNRASKDPINFDVGAPKKQSWDQQQEVAPFTTPREYPFEENSAIKQAAYVPPTIEHYAPPDSISATVPVMQTATTSVAVYPQMFAPIYSGKIQIDPKPIAFIKSLFLSANGVSSKLRLTPLLLTIMAVGLFSFGIYTNLHSLAVTKAIQTQAAVEATNQDSPATSSSSSGGTNAVVNSSTLSEAKPSTNTMAAYSVAPDKPKYITVPSLGIYARVIEVGVTKSDAVGTPSNCYDTAWFNQSAKPGQNGATLIDGHVLCPVHGAVFTQLKNIQDGAQIIITMGDNSTYSYTVRSTSIQNKDTINVNNLIKSIDPNKQGLNLITCTGTYLPKEETFNNRFIVYAVKN
jgi:hypothetical protein